ncbi:DUF1297 domain-containing protein [Nanoarchaeota archaeon]
MISREEVKGLLDKYDNSELHIGVLGGHSALDVARGAKKLGFKTVVVVRKDRAKTYTKYYKNLFDETILVDDFNDVSSPEVVARLQSLNTLFVHNRYFWVYCDYDRIENDFKVPILGTRDMVRLEERDVPKNQYYLLEKAGIRLPKMFASPSEIDRLAIVKVSEAARGYERAFFFCQDAESYKKKSDELLAEGGITKEALDSAVIEEYIVGAQINFNYFYSPLTDELELMGTDTRRQTNLDGLLRLPADMQLEVLKYLKPKLVETGHMAVTTKESILEKAFDIGEKFVSACKREHPIGIIGAFALQGAVASYDGHEDIAIFDVSMRIPGSPGTMFTPHTAYRYGDPISYGERIALEVKKALQMGKLDVICS